MDDSKTAPENSITATIGRLWEGRFFEGMFLVSTSFLVAMHVGEFVRNHTSSKTAGFGTVIGGMAAMMLASKAILKKLDGAPQQKTEILNSRF